MSDPLNEIILEFSHSVDRAKSNSTAANYRLVEMKLSELNGALREMHQSMTKFQMKEIIKKLGKNAPLTREEVDLIRDWIVGDATSYLDNERNFDAWLSLFTRLTRDLEEVNSDNVNPKRVMQLGALTHIAQRLIPNIIYYTSEKERVNRFDVAVSDGIDSTEAKAYREILLAKLDSSEY